MDLLEVAGSSTVSMKHGFKSLKLLNADMDEALGDEPFDVTYGKLDNGLRYYVRCNSKPKMRAALALAVKAGSVLEEEEERGVAHIIEHLAFSATKKYSNHDIIKFLESIGAEFGACQNASTSSDDTIYELFVPVDKPGLLSQAISVLAEFSSEVRVSKEDLEKERGAVLEEFRGTRNAKGRLHDAHWSLLMKGSKYAERLPIGLEKVIRTVSPEIVRQFYKKWYSINQMAVIAVGDFVDSQSVVKLIVTHFGQKAPSDNSPSLTFFPIPSHEEARFSCFVDSEASGSAVIVSYKMPAKEIKSLMDYKELLVESMFVQALNQRFFKISRRKDPPYFSCSAASNTLVRHTELFMISCSCKGRGALEALESILSEVARIRLHGFVEREITVVRSLLLSEIESAYLERDQMQSTSLCDEYLRHFLREEPVVGIEYEARLQKTILPRISAEQVSKYSDKLQASSNCVVKIIEPQLSAAVDDSKAVVLKIKSLEEAGDISYWDDEHVPEEIVAIKPNPGNIMQEIEYDNIGVTELIMSNGMRVCYKCTDFLDDQISFTGFAYGGLSEVPESEYCSCSMSSIIAAEIGVFGYKPSVLMDMLAGKRAVLTPNVEAYTRTFHCDCSPSELETALQLVYQLFTTTIESGIEEVTLVMQMAEEALAAEDRDPQTTFVNRVREINCGNSYFFRPMKINDFQKVDPLKSCQYFNDCFKDPSTFTVVIVGNIDPSTARPLILQYLGGIPQTPEPVLSFNRDSLRGLPFNFPKTIIREVVRSPMVEAQCSVQLCFPLVLKNKKVMDDTHYVGFLNKLLETKIMQSLRFKHGQVYSVGVSVFLGGNSPSRTGDVRGDLRVYFSCDPDISSTMVGITLDEVLHLQEEGPSDQDILTILEIEQRAHENGLEENYYWLDRIVHSYLSRAYSGNVGLSFQVQDEARLRVRKSLTCRTMQLALRRLIPFPCKEQYTCVVLMPRARSFFWKTLMHYAREMHGHSVIIAGAATLLAFCLWRFSHRT